MRQVLFVLLSSAFCSPLFSQNVNDYYYEIPEYPDAYTAGSVTGRLIDGLGFRFYWATAGLRAEDLAFRPTDESRTMDETIDHIYNLTFIMMNATEKKPTVFPVEIPEGTFEKKRAAILGFVRTASENLKKASDADFEDFKVVFKSAGGETAYPFWNGLNGPLADALWHTGQVVMLRRMSGNPFDSKANVMQGKRRE